MKVLFLSRSTLFKVKGGDTTQVMQTARALGKLGVTVDIKRSGESIDHKNYDLLHFFNLIRPADILPHLDQTSTPVVISPIYVDYSLFDQSERKGLSGLATRTLGKHGSEYLKTVLRAVRGQDRLGSIDYLLGHQRAMKQAIRAASMLLPNSKSEAQRIKKDLEVDFPYRVIPNAIDPTLFYPDPGITRKGNQVICVGQVEGRKNQHRLILACQNLDVDLVIIGKPSPNNVAYMDHCRSIAHERVKFIDFLPQEELRKWYSESTVHALPSWFETTGLSSLEAAACGCKLVVSEAGDTRDYFDGFAAFCQPESVESIQKAIEKALSGSGLNPMRETILERYTWDHCAEQTLKTYKEVLS